MSRKRGESRVGEGVNRAYSGETVMLDHPDASSVILTKVRTQSHERRPRLPWILTFVRMTGRADGGEGVVTGNGMTGSDAIGRADPPKAPPATSSRVNS